ncbi:MAG: sigma-70 family RNA polymerase sigma factor [Candidatus Hydrogenedens sp.]|nr:sigma-70 family RNA polymerase sigma factor [Candidatus Hydrogenedens sp.]
MTAKTEAKTNAEWLASLCAEDPGAILELRTYLARSLEKALAGRAGQSDTEDFAQQAVTRVLASLDRFRGDSRFTTWAAAIAVRVAYTELRRKRWGDRSLDAELERGTAVFLAPEPHGASRSAREELLGALREGIDAALTERQRASVLGELQEMPSELLAAELGMSRGALYKMHHEARKRLRAFLEARGFSVEDLRFALQPGTEVQ